MIKLLEGFESVIFKNHPAVDIRSLGDIKFKISQESIYNLFEDGKIVVTTASGTAVEAIACGVSVIIIGKVRKGGPLPFQYSQLKNWKLLGKGGG